jgi:predicted amidohydrolase YtcJ
VDGRNADVRANVDVVVDNRIKALHHGDKAHSDVLARNGRLVDASSETVIPGLWESHTRVDQWEVLWRV